MPLTKPDWVLTAGRHTTESLSQSDCVAAGGVNEPHMPVDDDQSSPVRSRRIRVMGMKNTGSALKGWDECTAEGKKKDLMGWERTKNTFSRSLSPTMLAFHTMPSHNRTHTFTPASPKHFTWKTKLFHLLSLWTGGQLFPVMLTSPFWKQHKTCVWSS